MAKKKEDMIFYPRPYMELAIAEINKINMSFYKYITEKRKDSLYVTG
jgi:hypothetical protein